MSDYRLIHGDCVEVMRGLQANSVQCCVTSPPYFGLRSYLDNGHADKPLEIGTESTPDAYVAKLVEVFREVRRVLHPTGVVWLNLGDSYAGSWGDYGARNGQQRAARVSEEWKRPGYENQKTAPPTARVQGCKPKDLIGIPWIVAFALRADGWWLRSEIIWHKRAPMPESVTDRPTKAHEQVFLLSKQANYFYDAEAIKEPNVGKFNDFSSHARIGNGTGRPRYDPNGQAAAPSGHVGADPAGRNKRSVWTLGPESFSGTTQTFRLERVERNALSDDTICKVSPDCPVHAGLFDWAAMDSYDVPIVDLLPRIARKRDRRAPKLTFDSAPIRQPHGAATVGESSDLPLLPHSLFATDHNNGSRKTAHDPVTNPAYTPCAQSSGRTGDKLGAHDSDELSPNKSLSNTVAGDSASNELSQTLDRNIRKYELPDSLMASVIPPECTCSFYHEVTDSSSHFATMPTKLVEPCILAGTSAKGCCAACGAPWERVVETERVPITELPNGHPQKRPNNAARYDGVSMRNDANDMRSVPFSETTGWSATCTCNAAVVPCTVLDPFNGSGTTGAVALKHHRNYIGIDLNADYLELAHDRIRKSQPMLLDMT